MKKIKKNILQYRLRWLCAMAGVGIGFAICFYKWGACVLGLSTDDRITNNLTILILSLPVLVLLWHYRTHDVKQQIEKAQSNINVNLLVNGINLLLSTKDKGGIDINKRSAGLIILAQLRQQDKQLHPQIDAITQGVNLSGAKLKGANLQGINLQGADLRGANLQNSDLENANLQGVDLQNIVFNNPHGRQIHRTNLEGANLEGANLEGALYSMNTIFSDGFNPKSEKMELKLIDPIY